MCVLLLLQPPSDFSLSLSTSASLFVLSDPTPVACSDTSPADVFPLSSHYFVPASSAADVIFDYHAEPAAV